MLFALIAGFALYPVVGFFQAQRVCRKALRAYVPLAEEYVEQLKAAARYRETGDVSGDTNFLSVFRHKGKKYISETALELNNYDCPICGKIYASFTDSGRTSAAQHFKACRNNRGILPMREEVVAARAFRQVQRPVHPSVDMRIVWRWFPSLAASVVRGLGRAVKNAVQSSRTAAEKAAASVKIADPIRVHEIESEIFQNGGTEQKALREKVPA